MPTIERDDQIRIEAFSERHHRCVGATQGKISILFDKVANAGPVVRRWCVDR